MTREYTCAECGGTFQAERSDEDAQAEARDNFGKDIFEREPMAVICHDCYLEFMRWYDPQSSRN